MLDAMAKRKKPPGPKQPYPSRANYKGVYIPKALAEELQIIADKQERSLSYIVKKACEAFRDANKKE